MKNNSLFINLNGYAAPKNKILFIIDELVLVQYQAPLTFENDEGFTVYYPSNIETRKMGDEAFEISPSGKLWINDDKFFHTISGFFGSDYRETLSLLEEYFSTKFNAKIKDSELVSDWAYL